MSSSQKPIIAVVTGTGAQGRAVCRTFHDSGEWHVRVLTRDPNGAVAKLFKSEGMEIVKVDFEDRESLLKAFQGAWAVFSVTIPTWHQAYANSLGEYAQGVLQADCSKEAGVQLFLFSTLPYVGPEFMGLGGVELYDAKARTNDYITSIGLPSVYLSTAIFTDNILSWPLIKAVDGGKRLEFWNHLVSKEKPVPFVWVERDLGPTVYRLTESFRKSGKPLSEHPLNHTFQAVASWRGTWGDVVREIQKQTGVPVTHKIIPDADKRWHRDLTCALIYQQHHGLYPDDEFPNPNFTALGVEYGTLEEYVREKIVPIYGKLRNKTREYNL